MNASASIEYVSTYPAVMNDVAATRLAADVASDIVGSQCVETQAEPVLGSEDFSYMLERKPGCYVFIGNGVDQGGCMIHNPGYDFNDEILCVGATYWVRLAQSFLSGAMA